MLNTATLTWNSFHNYGTLLQAYALQQYLKSLGYENHIIDDSKIVYAQNSAKKTNRINTYLYKLKRLLQRLQPSYRSFYSRQRIHFCMMENFKHNYLKIDYDIDAVLSDKKDYDVYICGSDQIWIPTDTECRHFFFFANFTKNKKISYAPSLGSDKIPESCKRKISSYLSSFSHISTREESGQSALQQITDKKIELVVDPTLLLPISEWKKVLKEIDCNEKYALCYFLSYNTLYIEEVKKYAHNKGLKLYLFFLDVNFYDLADRMIVGDPFDFLSYIGNAEIFFTDSFHGTIFSTILDTPFYTFKRFKDGCERGQNSRIYTLLNSMKAMDRMIDEDNIDIINKDTSIDCRQLRRNLEFNIQKSKAFLNKALDI